MPSHVAIIMDGNGRWARAKGQPRTFGHREGVEAIRRTVQSANRLGIRYLTVFGFSTENWSRPAQEVGFLMGLLKAYFGSRLAELIAGNVRIRIVGEKSAFEPEIVTMLDRAEADSVHCDGLQLVVALNYGGRAEIVRAARRALARGVKADEFDEAAISANLDAPDIPDPDLVIRTSGELRVSNFLLWQLAYAELYFADTLWPDFGEVDLVKALEQFQRRDRRFGGLLPLDEGSAT